MDDEVLLKALAIGAGTFMIIIVYTLIMSYYNTARDTATQIVLKGANFLEENDNYMITQILNKEVVLGSEIVSLLKYFSDSEEAKIYINECYLFDEFDRDGNYKLYNLGKKNIYPLNNTNEKYKKIINNIMPNQEFNLEVNNNNYIFKFKEDEAYGK